MNLIAAIESRLGPGWSIGDELGSGATSRIYLATRREAAEPGAERAPAVERLVVKVMKGGAAAHERAKHFLLEMRILQQMDHPNIVPFVAMGEAQGLPFFTMPFIEGDTLRRRLHFGGPLPLTDALRVTRDIAAALAHAHNHGVVHRDVKPENILLSPGGAILLDFGHARAPRLAVGVEVADARSHIVGTANYVSPEQVAGKRTEDSRSDIYSLGCVMHEMLSGKAPFSSTSPRATMRRRLEEPPPDIRAVREEVPTDVASILRRALDVDPAARFVSAGLMQEALDAALEVLLAA